MVRALWSGATGMIAQQNNVDTIANNIANVNTTGYKTEVNEFKSLLYQELQTRTTSANGEEKPVGAQVGLGVRNAAVTSQFTQGALLDSESDTALAINGDGFFGIRAENGECYYTRDGNFTWSIGSNGNLWLTNADGQVVLNTQGNPIEVTRNDHITSRIEIDSDGQLWYPDAQNNLQKIPNMQVGTWQFQNPKGLYKLGDNLYRTSDASGAALNEATNANLKRSQIRQGYLEGSNVQIADEMVNLIIAQRAYEMNSKVIQASDTMMQEANELRR
ncbi:MAG: flagellar hook-basal body protein [Lachnospiraceae bacterium]|nr:flagellar hook-basal body protein [Lachnospiraceae bacterium]